MYLFSFSIRNIDKFGHIIILASLRQQNLNISLTLVTGLYALLNHGCCLSTISVLIYLTRIRALTIM